MGVDILILVAFLLIFVIFSIKEEHVDWIKQYCEIIYGPVLNLPRIYLKLSLFRSVNLEKR